MVELIQAKDAGLRGQQPPLRGETHGKKLGFEFSALLFILLGVAFASFIYYSTGVDADGNLTFATSPAALANSSSAAGYANFTQFSGDNTTSFKDTIIETFKQDLSSLTGVIAGLTILLGTTLFPNPYLIFAGIFIFMLGFVDIPATVIGFNTGIPPIFTEFITVFFVIMMAISLVSWFKGQSGTP